jgi:hypothetical protein
VIESSYWKAELFVSAKEIKKRCLINRWTEKQAVLLEREIMLAMFSVRSLIERSKISDSLAVKPINVIAYPKKGSRPVTILNRFDLEDLYEFEREKKKTISLKFLCNQIIHSYIIFLVRDENINFTHIFVCSDFERNRFLYKVAIKDLIVVILEVARNYPSRAVWKFDSKIQDYRIQTSHAVER